MCGCLFSKSFWSRKTTQQPPPYRYWSVMEQQLQPTYPVSVTQGEDTLANISAPQEEVRTLYLSGFPFDVKQREVHNLLRFFPGYEECTFKTSGVAFALFSDSVKAAAAMQALNVRL